MKFSAVPFAIRRAFSIRFVPFSFLLSVFIRCSNLFLKKIVFLYFTLQNEIDTREFELELKVILHFLDPYNASIHSPGRLAHFGTFTYCVIL